MTITHPSDESVHPDEVVRHEFDRTHIEMSSDQELEERLSGIIDARGHRLLPALAFLLVFLLVIPLSLTAIMIFSWTL